MKITGALIWVAFLGVVQAEPPRIDFPNGATRVVHGKTIVEFLPDGSTRVISPVVSLTIPGKVSPDDPLPPKPPEPGPDELASSVHAIYGADTDPGKKDTLVKLIAYWREASALVNTSNTLGDWAQSLRGLPAIPADDLKPIRDLFREKIRADLGTRADAPLDKAKATSLINRFVSALEGCR